MTLTPSRADQHTTSRCHPHTRWTETRGTPNTITEKGKYNCIVGGGGRDTVNGDSTDICIIGPTSGATYRNCTKRS